MSSEQKKEEPEKYFVVWVEDGDFCGPEEGTVIGISNDLCLVQLKSSTKIVHSSQISKNESDLFKRYPEGMLVSRFSKDEASNHIETIWGIQTEDGVRNLETKKISEHKDWHPIFNNVGRYFLCMLNRGQQNQFDCADESLRRFLKIDVNRTRIVSNPDANCKAAIKQRGPTCAIYSAINLFRRHPLVLKMLEEGYPDFFHKYLFETSWETTCPPPPAFFWLAQYKKVYVQVIISLLYVLAKTYPKTFGLHFDTSKEFKLEKGHAYLSREIRYYKEFLTNLQEMNRRGELRQLSGMQLGIFEVGSWKGHIISIGRCGDDLVLTDPNFERSINLTDLNQEFFNKQRRTRRKNETIIKSMFWWSWKDSESKQIAKAETRQKRQNRIKYFLSENAGIEDARDYTLRF